MRSTNAIERCFVALRRQTRPMAVFTPVESMDRIFSLIFIRLNEDEKDHMFERFTRIARRHWLPG